ncbi:MAG: hypothetical protein A2284_03450 [Deltaproteobacteria bacterium RIFOXYA12_FULL_61_11]|nr:MAG: hypothetical protein A2284_03450 [Deltaproteobacteria bacterium RIFOXYA12_FULL_61_11]
MVGETLVETPVAYQLRVSDGRASVLEANSLIAVPVNDPPSLTIGPCGPALVGQLFTCSLAVSDPDSEAFTFTARAPAGATVNQQTHTVSWLPAFADLGLVTFRVSVSDGSAEDSETASVTVRNQDTGGTCDECQYVPPPGVFSPVVEWAIDTFTLHPTYNQVMSTPMVGNLTDDNGDGRIDLEDTPDVVFATFTSNQYWVGGVLRAVHGDGSGEIFATSPGLVKASAAVALGDIDHDGFLEIAVEKYSGGGLIVFEHDGTVKWQVDGPTFGHSAIAIGDLDQDGEPEVVHGDMVYTNTGTLLWQTGDHVGGALPVLYDLNGDTKLDLLVGNRAYRHDGVLLWQNVTIPAASFAGVGNFDADPQPEVVFAANDGAIHLTDHLGQIVWRYSFYTGCTTPAKLGSGAPNIGDFDGDGEAEVATATACAYIVIDTDGTLLWEDRTTKDWSSHRTSSSIFDFDGDGNAEAVYADELRLKIYDGASGQVLFETPNSSGTLYENPVIADVDNDGNAEIVLMSNDYVSWGTHTGIRVFGDERDNWVPTRRIWNQHSYHVTNVEENGTIPRVEPSNLVLYNNFRQNVQGEFSEDVFDAPDLRTVLSWVDRGGCPGRIVYEVLLLNEGEMQLGSGVQLGVYGVDGAGERFLVSALSEEGIPSCSQTLLRVELASSALTGLQEVILRADDPSRHNECNENNNAVRFTPPRCP